MALDENKIKSYDVQYAVDLRNYIDWVRIIHEYFVKMTTKYKKIYEEWMLHKLLFSWY